MYCCVQEFTLPNGLHFIVLNRDVAPVVATHIFANVGAFQEVDGQTGKHTTQNFRSGIGMYLVILCSIISYKFTSYMHVHVYDCCQVC